jgi:very-short-patch-repair endonuclease
VHELIVGSEALASGTLTRQALRARYVKVHQNVYAPKGLELTPCDRAHAAWLWSRREAVLVGRSAAAMLGAKWLPSDEPAELARSQFRSPKGIVAHSGAIADDEIMKVRGIPCTTAARTAYDIGRRMPMSESIIRVDALVNATRLPVSAVKSIADRYPGARGIRRLRAALDLVDGGAESPQETRLRLLLVRSIEPRVVTQIPVRDDRGRVRRRIDMGYPEWMVGVEYDGEQHFDDAEAYANDIMRLEFLANRGWTIVRVSSRQLRDERREIIARVRRALVANGMH